MMAAITFIKIIPIFRLIIFSGVQVEPPQLNWSINEPLKLLLRKTIKDALFNTT